MRVYIKGMEMSKKILQGACVANFVAKQLSRLRKMTEEERWDFLIKFFNICDEIGDVGMGNKHFRIKCYWFNEYQDMNATVPTCDYYGQYGSCPCSDECEHYISKQEAENIIRRSKKGQWEYCKHAGISDVWKCNQCGAWMFGKTNFCPNCGAIMKDGEIE